MAFAVLVFLTQYSLTYVPDREVYDAAAGGFRRELSLSALGLLGVVIFLARKGWQLKWHLPLFFLWAALGVWLALSLSWSPAPGLGIRRLGVLLMIFAGAYGLLTLLVRHALLPFLVVSAGLQTAVGVLSEIRYGSFTPFEPGYRFSGTLSPNEQGAVCAVLVLASIAAFQSNVGHKVLFGVTGLAAVTLLLLTNTLTSIGGFLAGISWYLFLRISARGRRRITYLGVMLLLAVILIVSAIGLSLDPFASLTGRHPDDMMTLTGRLSLWSKCMEYVAMRPLLGYGFGGQLWTPDRTGDLDSEFSWLAGSAHSAYIELWLEVGIVGLVLHTLTLLLVLRRAAFIHRTTRSPEYALASSLVVFYLMVGALESASLIWFSSFLFLSYCLFLMVAFVPMPEGGQPFAKRLGTVIHEYAQVSGRNSEESQLAKLRDARPTVRLEANIGRIIDGG